MPSARPQTPKTLRGSFDQALCAAASTRHSGHSPLFDQALMPQPSVVKGVQACCLPGLKRVKPCAATSTRHSGHSPLFDQALRPQPSVVKGVQACRLPSLKPLKLCAAASTRHSGHSPLFDQALRPQPSVVKGVQACQLPGLKRLKPCAAASTRHSARQLRPGTQATALCSTRHSCHSPLLLRAFKPAVCQASNA